MRMYFKAFVLRLLVITPFVFSTSCSDRTSKEEAAIRVCVTQMRRLDISIITELMVHTNVGVMTAMSNILQREGVNFFYCQPCCSNEPIRINPNAYNVPALASLSNDVSVYCPTSERQDRWIAISMTTDDEIILSNRPTWRPITVLDLNRGTNKQAGP